MLTPRAIDNRVVTDIAAADLLKTIAQSPAAFEVVLFPASLNDFEEQTAIADVVGNLEAREAIISYQSPVLTKAIELPVDLEGAFMLASGEDSLDEPEEPICLLLEQKDVPEQSVVWIEEQLEDDETKVSLWYLLHSRPIGKHGQGGAKHYFIPFTGHLGDVSPTVDSGYEQAEAQPSEDESVTILLKVGED